METANQVFWLTEEKANQRDGHSKTKIVTNKDRQLGSVGDHQPAEDLTMDRMNEAGDSYTKLYTVMIREILAELSSSFTDN